MKLHHINWACKSNCTYLPRQSGYYIINCKLQASAESEYQAIAYTSSELMWLKHFLEELMFEVPLPMSMYCDNQVAVHIASNPAFHEMTKHIEVDCHIIRERVEKGVIVTPFISTSAQLADMFAKPMFKPRLEFLCSKLGLCDI